MKRNLQWGLLALGSLALTAYFSIMIQEDTSYIPFFAKVEPITNVCNEPSFLKCVNKNKKECLNSFNLSYSYCEKKHVDSFDGDNSNLKKSMRAFMKCTADSWHAYYDNDSENFNKCLNTSSYGKKLQKTMRKELKK